MQRKPRMGRYWAWILTLIFLGISQPVAAIDLAGIFQLPQPQIEAPASKMKMTMPVSKIITTISEKTVSSSGSYQEITGLYDGDAQTSGGTEEPVWVTLDLGTTYRLAGVRFLPLERELGANRCIGTRFSVSADNKTFFPVAVIEPMDGGSYTADWKELIFDSAGDYRYVRAEFPAGAYFAELEWLAYTDWVYTHSQERGKKDLSIGLVAYDVQENMDALVLAALYNRNGVLKKIVQTEQQFLKDNQTKLTVKMPGVTQEYGDSCRILVLEKDGTPVLSKPLRYQENGASRNFSLPNLFSDDMMFQAEKPLTVWGKAPTKSRITVTLENRNGGQVVRTTQVRQGSDWEVDLGSFSAGGEYRLTVQCDKEKKIYENITFGDVWLCMGQSNMDYYMLGGEDTEAYLASAQGRSEAENPNIRLLNLWNQGIDGAGAPVENLPLASGGQTWFSMSRDVANYCSAIGYFFAQGIQREYNIPVGILNVAVGDTEINRWIPRGDTYGSFTSTDGGLFYNRVAPFAKLQIRGILMYQGEADQYRTGLTTLQYRDAMAGLVDRYREIWGKELPFYWAQLTRYKKDEGAIREGQRLALKEIAEPKNAGVIALIDLYGEYEAGTGNCREDIHPHQKKEVAERFLRYAKRDVYGESDLEVSGPVYRSVEVVGNKMVLTFESTGDLAVLPVGRYADRQGEEYIKQQQMDPLVPQEFEIAGADGVFVRAEAELSGNQVILHSDQVPVPVVARYAWGAYPEMPNLTDATGLPALAFTTDGAK